MADDRRDERLAEHLEVEPLDELTRRRLVTRALEASTPARAGIRWQPLAAAAAVVLVVVAGLAVLLRSGDGGTPPEQALRPSATTAADGEAEAQSGAADLPATSPSPSSEDATSAAGGAASRNAADGGSTLGDFGDLSQRANRTRAVEAARAARTEHLTLDDAESDTTGFDAAAPGAAACVPTGAGPVVAYGTGTFAGRPALVLVTRHDDGSVRARLVVAEPCEVRDLTS